MAQRDGEREGDEGKSLPPCSFHAEREAVARCVSCGRTVCAACDRRRSYFHKCPLCFEREAAAYPPLPGGHPGYRPVHPYPPYPGYYPYYPYYPVPVPVHHPVEVMPEPQDARERRWWRADWKLYETAVALLVVFGLYNVLALILLLTTDNPLFYNYLAYAVFFCPLILASVLYILRRHGRGREELGLRWGRAGRTLLYGVAGSLVAMALSYGAYFAIYLIFYLIAGRGPVSGEAERLRELGGSHIALVVLVVVLLAPFFEELFFRGILYPALRRRVGANVAIVTNGIIFGALHFQPLFIFSLLLVGIVLAYLYERSDSLLAPMAAHALYNLMVTLITIFVG